MLIITNKIDDTQEQINNIEKEQVIDELADKIFVETLFIRDLNKFFDKVVKVFEADLKLETNKSFSINTKSIDVERLFADDVDSLLKNNYKLGVLKATQRFMSDPFVNQLYSKLEIRRIIEESLSNMDYYIVNREIYITPKILNTTAENLIESRSFVDKFISDNNLTLTASEKNSMIVDNLSNRLKNRSEGIAVTETQNIYQETKQTYGNAINKKLNEQGKSLDKRWNAILDQKTRSFHAQAHGQRVPTQALYIVGGEALMYPGDSNHGATKKNLINCRCESIQTLIVE